MVYILGIQCINVFNYIWFECVTSVFARAMLRRLSTRASGDCKQTRVQLAIWPGGMAAHCVESSSL